MATFKVSVLKGTKGKPELIEVSNVVADRVAINASAAPKRDLFSFETYGIAFYNDESSFLFGSDEKLVSFFPGTDWIIETV